MNIVESNTIQKTILVYLEVESLDESQKLENGYGEFKSLAVSSGLLIKSSLKFKQRSPVINTFISKGKLDKLKNLVLELSNRSYVIYFHNDPLTMKGSKTITDRKFLLKS